MSHWFWGKDKEELAEKKPNPDCKHLRTYIQGGNWAGCGWCPDCGCQVQLMDVFNNFLDEMRKELKHEQD